MTHPLMFADDNPDLGRLRPLALSFPGATEKVSHGRPTWRTTRQFASYGGHVKGTHGDTSLARALLFKPDVDHRDLLLRDERFVVPAYEGAYGWLAIALDTWDPDEDEVLAWLDESFRMTAPHRLVTELDARETRHHR